MKFYQQRTEINSFSQSNITVTRKRKSFFIRLMQLLTPLLVLAITGISMYFILFKLDIFYISDIQVTGAKTFVSSTDIFELAKTRSYGKNIFTYPIDDLKSSLRKDFQGAREVYVHKQFPNKISVFVVERVPVAVMTNDKSAESFLVDEEGYVLGIVDPQKTNLPKILYSGDIAVGYFLNKESLAIYFEVLKSSDTERIKASSMSLHSDYISMYVDDTVEVLIGKDKDITKAINVISSILTQLKTEGKNVKRIDLRFEKVIVSYR